MSYSNPPSVRFPPGTITSKLSSKMLKQPPSSKDWMHQTYMQMIQDVSYVTSHYYESPENGTSLLSSGINKAISNSKPPRLSETDCHSVIVETTRIDRPIKNSSPLSQYEFHNDSDGDNNSEQYSSDEEALNEDDDDEADLCYTTTTSSTDCNRKNNIYRLYKEQQSLQKPFDEELKTTIPIAQRSNSCQMADYDVPYLSNTSNSADDSTSSHVTQDTNVKKNKQQPNKKFKKFKRMMTKMRMAAENPFWAIDNRF